MIIQLTIKSKLPAIVLPKVAASFPHAFFSFTAMDLVEFGGAKIFAGYGLGTSAKSAFTELLAYRDSTHIDGRYNVVYQVPEQPASVSLQTSGTTNTRLNATATVFVRFSDYNKQGYYFVGASNPTATEWFIYNGQTWVAFTTNIVSFGQKAALRNKVLTITSDLTNGQLAGFKLYAGYAVGENIQTAFAVFQSNSQGTRNITGYTIPSNPGDVLNENNWDVVATTSGVVSSFSAQVQIAIATAHKDKKGYMLLVAEFEGTYYVLDIAKKLWVKWDGAMVGFSSPANLVSTGTAGITMASALDVTSLGGAKLYAGYGVGDTIVAAVTECLGKPRLKEIGTLEKQLFKAEVIIPNYNKTSTQTYEVQFNITPNYKDYGLPGRYYVAVFSPGENKFYVYQNNVWNLYVDANSDSLYTLKTDQVKNYSLKISLKGTELASVSGWHAFTGYGISVRDMLDRKLHSNGTVVP